MLIFCLPAYSTIYKVYVHRSSEGSFKFIFKVIILSLSLSMSMCVMFIDNFKYESICECTILKRLLSYTLYSHVENLRTP